MSTNRSDKRNLDFIDSWKVLLSKANPEFQNEIEYAVYIHIIDILNIFPRFIDKYMNFFQLNMQMFEQNKIIEKDIQNKKIIDLFKIKFIPKKIHYIWFGNGQLSDLNIKCIESWKRYASDYEIIKWDESNCNVKENKYVEEAYNNKKWAFVTDYFRFKIINEQGGFYVDTDIEFNSNIDKLRLHNTFFAFEMNNIVNGGFLGSTQNTKIIRNIVDSYKNNQFMTEDGLLDTSYTVPKRITNILLDEYGLVLNGENQILKGDIAVYSVNELTIDVGDGKNIAEHHYDYSWAESDETIPYKYFIMQLYFRDLFKKIDGKDFLFYEDSKSWKITKPLRLITKLQRYSKSNGLKKTIKVIGSKIIMKLKSKFLKK